MALLQSRIPQLELLDVSFNEFSAEGLISMVQIINRLNKKEVKLRSLSLAGNDLGNPNAPLKLIEAFKDLFEKTFL